MRIGFVLAGLWVLVNDVSLYRGGSYGISVFRGIGFVLRVLVLSWEWKTGTEDRIV